MNTNDIDLAKLLEFKDKKQLSLKTTQEPLMYDLLINKKKSKPEIDPSIGSEQVPMIDSNLPQTLRQSGGDWRSSDTRSVESNSVNNILSIPGLSGISNFPILNEPQQFPAASLPQNQQSNGLGGSTNASAPSYSMPTLDQKKKEELEKYSALLELHRLVSKHGIVLSRRYTQNDPLEEILAELYLHKNYRKKLNDMRFMHSIIRGGCYVLERGNQHFDPFDINLDGWNDAVGREYNDFEDIYSDLHTEYEEVFKNSPWFRLGLGLVVSGATYGAARNYMKDIPDAKINMNMYNAQQQTQQTQQTQSPQQPPQQALAKQVRNPIAEYNIINNNKIAVENINNMSQIEADLRNMRSDTNTQGTNQTAMDPPNPNTYSMFGPKHTSVTNVYGHNNNGLDNYNRQTKYEAPSRNPNEIEANRIADIQRQNTQFKKDYERDRDRNRDRDSSSYSTNSTRSRVEIPYNLDSKLDQGTKSNNVKLDNISASSGTESRSRSRSQAGY